MRVLATIDVDDDDDEDGCLPILARVRLCSTIVICLISSASAFLDASLDPPSPATTSAASSSPDRRHTRATSHEPTHPPHEGSPRVLIRPAYCSVERCVYSREWGGVQNRGEECDGGGGGGGRSRCAGEKGAVSMGRRLTRGLTTLERG